ncbi:hypothetical protein FGO68_gene15072 [Halteria grandinella]|uniref:6-phosphogluconolactonase n=1 Tax=Halteria grandinella TaxID=5974 RepID=A0A8J8NKR5_HALGN|nr:hypothetical protein FGO68_gene15072 [Halteria grandinella]
MLRTTPYLFILAELSNHLLICSWSPSTPSDMIKPLSSLSTLPSEFSGESISADIHVHPNGKVVYTSNRGYDSIAVFGFDESEGRAELVRIVRVNTEWPRSFTLDKDAKYMLVAGQKSGNIVVLEVSEDGKELTENGVEVKDIGMPVCLIFEQFE